MNRNASYYIIGAIAAAVLWYFFAYSPIAAKIENDQLRLEEADEHLADFETTILELPQYLDTRNRLERFRQSLNSRLYAKNDILELFRRLNIEAEQRDLSIVEIIPPLAELIELNRSASSAPTPEFINIELEMEGGFIEYARFVRFIEQADFCHGVNLCEIGAVDDYMPGMARLRLGFKALLGYEGAAP